MVDYRHYDFPNVLAGEQPVPVAENRSMGFGTWILVILVTGVIAAAVTAGIVMFGIPAMEQAQERGKWAEAKANAGMINAAMQVIKAENSGSLPEDVIQSGSFPDVAEELDLEVDEFEGRYFAASDYQVVVTNAQYGEYYIEVTSSRPDGPAGTYRHYWDGTVEEW